MQLTAELRKGYKDIDMYPPGRTSVRLGCAPPAKASHGLDKKHFNTEALEPLKPIAAIDN